MPFEKDEQQNLAALIGRAQALMDIERWSEAVAILNKGLGAHPDNHWILCSLSLSHLNMGDRNRAMDYANRAVSVAPEEEWGHRLRGFRHRHGRWQSVPGVPRMLGNGRRRRHDKETGRAKQGASRAHATLTSRNMPASM